MVEILASMHLSVVCFCPSPLSQTYHILLSSIASYAHEPQIFEINGN
jgi:hypothetical protein